MFSYIFNFINPYSIMFKFCSPIALLKLVQTLFKKHPLGQHPLKLGLNLVQDLFKLFSSNFNVIISILPTPSEMQAKVGAVKAPHDKCVRTSSVCSVYSPTHMS